ncbi:Signal recognition particle protein [Coemansia sp. RSA 2671]|nr:Signal recognition particle protein [Coemansia sp. S610]KAJ2348253.1 Signal recognition particle protein [Coemansia sp. RSA 2671]KAJ2372498.1 Signal recognition particle protein [Coemansia sp. RSA 2611]KAJ2416048.1 Signal recognition particle protein [Coemansia sp. RSA 2530]KAJ2701753.1 Signal recognition particle protein [Coemansia sp. IMI 209128]
MVFYDSWESFEKAAAAVYAGAAGKTRYTIKYRNCDAALVLKVTDDCTCVQMRTERLSDIKKIAHLHRMLAQATSNRSEPIKELAPIFPASLTKSEGQAKKAGSSEPAKQAPQTTAAVAQSKKKGRGKKRN